MVNATSLPGICTAPDVADVAGAGDVDGSAPWFVLPDVPEVSVGVGAGLDGSGLVGSAVGDGDCDGDWDGLDVAVGDGDVGGVAGELDDMVGDGDSDGDCVGVAVGDGEGVGQAVDGLPGKRGRDVGSVGAGLVGPGPVAGEAVFAPPVVEVNTGPRVGVAVAGGLQCAVMAPPGVAALLRVVVAAAPPELVAPPGRLPLPAGAPPPLPPGWPDGGPPVSMVELTCTIACRNGGTASAMLAMNAMPASTPTGRNQVTVAGRPGFGAAACRGGGA